MRWGFEGASWKYFVVTVEGEFFMQMRSVERDLLKWGNGCTWGYNLTTISLWPCVGIWSFLLDSLDLSRSYKKLVMLPISLNCQKIARFTLCFMFPTSNCHLATMTNGVLLCPKFMGALVLWVLFHKLSRIGELRETNKKFWSIGRGITSRSYLGGCLHNVASFS